MKGFKVLFFVLLSVLTTTTQSFGQLDSSEQHVKVAMRMIGHEVLIASGDYTSRVLPIEKELDRYKISFESEFAFVPDELMTIVSDVVDETKIASGYVVEIEECATGKIAHSYKIIHVDSLNMLPCQLRGLPKACYTIFFTITDTLKVSPIKSTQILDSEDSGSINYFMIILSIFLFLMIVFLAFRLRKKPQAPKQVNANLIQIGDYKFDKIQMELFYAKNKVELTSKESDLLILLFNSSNQVVERDIILQSVWGDEGDYVGRTLDVFISKLRKKLAKDDNVKIVNVRGVGYKLIIANLAE